MLLIIIITSLILRLISLNQSFWLDEAVQVWTTRFSISDLILNYMPGDFNPPLYHFLTHYWARLGTGEEIVRILPLTFGVLSVFLIYKISEIIDKKNKPFIYLSSFLIATSPLHIYYSQENRMYILACAATLLTTFFHLSFWKKPTLKKAILYSLSITTMGFSHFLTLFTIPVFFIFDLINSKKEKKMRTTSIWLLPYILLLISYLIYSPLFIKQLQTGMEWTKQFPAWGKTVGNFSLKAAALLPVKFIIGRISIDNKLLYGAVSIVLTVLYWGLTSLAIIKNTARKKKNIIYLISLLLFVPPLAGFLISFAIPVFSYFRFLFCLPFFYLLISWQVSKSKKFFKPIAVALIIINLACSGMYLANSQFHREDWRGMVSWLQQRNSQYNGPVLISSQISKPFDHYNKNNMSTIYINNFSDIEKIKPILKQTIYLVSYGLPIFDPEDKIRTELKNNNFKMTKGESFRKVGVEEWRIY